MDVNIDFDLCKQAVIIISKDSNPLGLIIEARKKSKLIETPSVKVMNKGIFWDDIANGNDWRIQQNKLSKHFRLLSPESIHQGNAYWEKFSKFLSYIVEIGKKNQGSTEFKINDSSLDLSDRRVIVIVADNGFVKYGGAPHYTISKAKKSFKFPPNHPVANTAYAMTEVYPEHYIQLSEFHEYITKTKHEAFIELCANLGAKEICIESVEINNKSLDINGDIKTPLVKCGLNISHWKNTETGVKNTFKFPEENSKIKDYDSPWLIVEPSWRTMNNLRRKNHLKEFRAEFNYTDDMGVNTKLAATFKGVGINIGGGFSEMTKIRLNYNVLFW